jgi:uncharacterized membrane protein
MTEEQTPLEPPAEEPVIVEPVIEPSSDITSDDKLFVLLAYLFSPLVPVIILFLQDKKDRPFIKAHNMQALVMGVIEILLTILVGWTIFLGCIPFILWLVMIYWGIQGFQGKYVNIPVVTNFVKGQGWA